MLGFECLFNYKPYNGKAVDIVECFSDSLQKCGGRRDVVCDSDSAKESVKDGSSCGPEGSKPGTEQGLLFFT